MTTNNAKLSRRPIVAITVVMLVRLPSLHLFGKVLQVPYNSTSSSYESINLYAKWHACVPYRYPLLHVCLFPYNLLNLTKSQLISERVCNIALESTLSLICPCYDVRQPTR